LKGKHENDAMYPDRILKSSQKKVQKIAIIFRLISLEYFHHVLSHVGVEAGSGLVAEHEGRVGQDLGREGQSFALTTRNALDSTLDPDQRVGAFRQAELEMLGRMVN
jgi:hypothetical protein